MSVLDDGRPLVVSTEQERIGRGPWARLFASAVVGDESSSSAERGRALARAGAVHTLAVDEGMLSARVEEAGRECLVELAEKVIAGRSEDWLGDLDLGAIRAAVELSVDPAEEAA